MLHFPFCFSLVLILAASCLSYPDIRYDTLERLVYEGRKADGSSLASIVHPCRYRPGTNGSIAAEWLRFAFHDAITHNKSDGSGGVDGSIAYELGRSENLAVGLNNSLGDFAAYPNKYTSRSDIIALAAVFAVATCGGPVIPYRAGRSDSWTAGPPGVPVPQQDIQTLISMFQNSGFDSSEMIQLVACGHTLGGVRSTDFPELVPPGPNPAAPQFSNFDTSSSYDNLVVTQYLDGITQNPLVVNSHKNMTSDMRIFSSDSNTTVRSMVSPAAYSSTCQSILERMINLVPGNVTLTPPITLLPVKVQDVQLTFERNTLVFKASLRLLQEIGAPINTNRTVTMLWCDKRGGTANCNGVTRSALPASTVNEDPNLSPMTQRQNYSFINYNFVFPVDPVASISGFWFRVDEKNGSTPSVYNNGGSNYVVEQDQLLFVPMLSHQVLADSSQPQRRGGSGPSGVNYFKEYTIVAAVREDSNISRVYMHAVDMATPNFTAPFNSTIVLQRNDTIAPTQGYSFYTSSAFPHNGFQLTLDMYGVTPNGTLYYQDFMQTTFLDNTPYVAPTLVSNTTKSQSSSGRLIDEWWKAQLYLSAAGLLLRTLI
ncbi:L-ascorbate oxidase [Tricholoma matsutake]|nr:L-ascorbate oxidase [Tricholoma matsutake 945]